MKLTPKAIRKYKPCYDPTEIEGITETTSMTLFDWIKYKSKKLTDADKVWLFAKYGTDLQRRIFAIWCARQCKTKNKEIKEYINVIEKYYILKTATKKEMESADESAYRPAYSSAYESADRPADRPAYWSAYWSANELAEESAERSAYMSADWSAYELAYESAYESTRKKQIKQIIKILDND